MPDTQSHSFLLTCPCRCTKRTAMPQSNDAGVKNSRLQSTACVTPISRKPNECCNRNCRAMSPVPAAIIQRALAKLP